MLHAFECPYGAYRARDREGLNVAVLNQTKFIDRIWFRVSMSVIVKRFKDTLCYISAYTNRTFYTLFVNVRNFSSLQILITSVVRDNI